MDGVNGHAEAVANGKTQYSSTYNGIEFMGYLDRTNTLLIKNYHPQE